MKHIGKQISTNDKLVIVFREVPGEPDNCLVVKTRALGEVEHDSLMEVLEGLEGQQANTLADVLHRHMNRTGRPILESLHNDRKIVKLPTTDVALTPDARNAVALNEVNEAIRANEIGDASGGIGVGDPTVPVVAPGGAGDVMNDQQIAESLNSQAAMMESEAKRLREEAKDLTQEPVKKKKSTSKKKTKARATA